MQVSQPWGRADGRQEGLRRSSTKHAHAAACLPTFHLLSKAFALLPSWHPPTYLSPPLLNVSAAQLPAGLDDDLEFRKSLQLPATPYLTPLPLALPAPQLCLPCSCPLAWMTTLNSGKQKLLCWLAPHCLLFHFTHLCNLAALSPHTCPAAARWPGR